MIGGAFLGTRPFWMTCHGPPTLERVTHHGPSTPLWVTHHGPHPFFKRVTHHGPPLPLVPPPLDACYRLVRPLPLGLQGSPPLKRMTHPRMMNGRHDAKCFILIG